jgi:hypothetical protein
LKYHRSDILAVSVAPGVCREPEADLAVVNAAELLQQLALVVGGQLSVEYLARSDLQRAVGELSRSILER